MDSIEKTVKKKGTPKLYYCSENSLVFIGDFGDLPIDQIF